MPLYDYKICETGEVVEVMHSSSTEISTWGEPANGIIWHFITRTPGSILYAT
jgi:predicted nucleic acid-binding Zn ribbon protein